MSDLFLIEGPAVISFSGGRTSGYMLHRILDAGLQPNVHVLFADTGQEREETYTFVRACADRWSVPIHWIERPGQFTQLITDKKFLPNPVMRFCTHELKIRPMKLWMLAHGYQRWTNVIGIRADEPRRVARMKESEQRRSERWEIDMPLATAGVIKADVMAFWDNQPFDLGLEAHEGNCAGCFLKGADKLRNIARDRPDLLIWWAEQERRIGGTFRSDRQSYARMLAESQMDLFKAGDSQELTECYCTD